MPLTSQTIAVSGATQVYGNSKVFVTYEGNELGYQGQAAQYGNQNIVPAFMWITGGKVVYTIDSQGNVHAVNPNKDGSIPT